jgi:hypothetical protein
MTRSIEIGLAKYKPNRRFLRVDFLRPIAQDRGRRISGIATRHAKSMLNRQIHACYYASLDKVKATVSSARLVRRHPHIPVVERVIERHHVKAMTNKS